MSFRLRVPLLLPFIIGVAATPAMAAPCPVPNTITNGQVADASKVMDNFNAVATCAQQAVTTTGAPTTGAIPVFSGVGSITGGNLTGDVTTSGSTATTLANTGVAPGTYVNPSISVDAKGRIISAISGSGGSGGGVTPTLVQSAGARGLTYTQSSVTANLPSSPTQGNLLVAIVTGYSGGTNLSCPTSFSSFIDQQNIIPNQGILVCARKATAAETGSYTTNVSSPNGTTTLFIMELAWAQGITAICSRGRQVSNTWRLFGAKSGINTLTIAVTESDAVNNLSSAVGANVIYDGTAANAGGAGHPALILSIPALNDATLTYNTSSFSDSIVCYVNISG